MTPIERYRIYLQMFERMAFNLSGTLHFWKVDSHDIGRFRKNIIPHPKLFVDIVSLKLLKAYERLRMDLDYFEELLIDECAKESNLDTSRHEERIGAGKAVL